MGHHRLHFLLVLSVCGRSQTTHFCLRGQWTRAQLRAALDKEYSLFGCFLENKQLTCSITSTVELAANHLLYWFFHCHQYCAKHGGFINTHWIVVMMSWVVCWMWPGTYLPGPHSCLSPEAHWMAKGWGYPVGIKLPHRGIVRLKWGGSVDAPLSFSKKEKEQGATVASKLQSLNIGICLQCKRLLSLALFFCLFLHG